jgi:signal transduction histidine kinase
MTVSTSLVLTRSGVILAILPAGPGDVTELADLEPRFPGLGDGVERMLATRKVGDPAFDVPVSPTTSVRVHVVDAVAVQYQQCDATRVVREALTPIERQAVERDVNLRFDAPETPPIFARIDPAKIAWVVSALVGNSLRFVRTGSRNLPGGSILVRLRRDEGALIFEVEDDGTGMPPVILEELLRPGKPVLPCRGVALRLAREIVIAHGGSFSVTENGQGIGTLVRFTLPASATSA